MIEWQLGAFFLILIALLFLIRRYVARLWRDNLFQRGGPHRAGLLVGISAELPEILVVSLAIIVNLFHASFESLTFMLGFLTLLLILTFPIGYAFGRYHYNIYSEKEVERLKRQYEARQKHL